MKTFQDEPGRFKAKRTSARNAELSGMSERSFRRYRHRCDEEGTASSFRAFQEGFTVKVLPGALYTRQDTDRQDDNDSEDAIVRCKES